MRGYIEVGLGRQGLYRDKEKGPARLRRPFPGLEAFCTLFDDLNDRGARLKDEKEVCSVCYVKRRAAESSRPVRVRGLGNSESRVYG
jgi:hypothetical protein